MSACAKVQAYEIKWLQDLPPDLQDQYFEDRNRTYLTHWERRMGGLKEVAVRDEYDEDYVVATVNPDGRIVGGVRATVARAAFGQQLPLEKHGGIRLADLFPHHRLDEVPYAEAGKLFVNGTVDATTGRRITLNMLNFLLDNVRGVPVVYFCVPALLHHHYRLLARVRGVPCVYRELDGLTDDYIGGAVKQTGWGIFACFLSGIPDFVGTELQQ